VLTTSTWGFKRMVVLQTVPQLSLPAQRPYWSSVVSFRTSVNFVAPEVIAVFGASTASIH